MILPKHIAIIVDGNRRWAKKRNLPSLAGHKYVVEHILEPIIYRCLELKIPYLTFWAFSTENWKRGEKFASSLFNLMRQKMKKSVKKYHEKGIRLNTIGDLSRLPKDLTKTIEKWKKQSQKNKKIMVTIALNYGGRNEIVRAIKKILKLKPKTAKITEKNFSQFLDTSNMPDPDLIIRTGGEQRLSGFMLWQAQYSELYFTKTLMPDFNLKEFEKALKDFCKRKRRFGK